MPGDSEHPVTVGDLRLPCEHRVFGGRHHVNLPHVEANPDGPDIAWCDGGRPATVADLVSALGAEGVLEITKLISYSGVGPEMSFRYVLNLPAEAQPFPPAGG